MFVMTKNCYESMTLFDLNKNIFSKPYINRNSPFIFIRAAKKPWLINKRKKNIYFQSHIMKYCLILFSKYCLIMKITLNQPHIMPQKIIDY